MPSNLDFHLLFLTMLTSHFGFVCSLGGSNKIAVTVESASRTWRMASLAVSRRRLFLLLML